MHRGSVSTHPSNTHTRAVDNGVPLWRGEKERVAADGGGTEAEGPGNKRKAEECLCVSPRPALRSSSRCHPVELIINGDVCQVDVPSHPLFSHSTRICTPHPEGPWVTAHGCILQTFLGGCRRGGYFWRFSTCNAPAQFFFFNIIIVTGAWSVGCIQSCIKNKIE